MYITDRGYTFAKLIGKKNEVDSVRISFALFADTDSRDSVMAKVNSGEVSHSPNSWKKIPV